MKAIGTIVILLGIVGGAAAYYVRHAGGPSVTHFRTAEIERGDLLSTIDATGTLQAEEVVNVGAQVAGRIIEFGEDPKSPSKYIDYCSVVEKGTLLAKIDPTFYEATLEQAEAALEKSQATLLQYEAKLAQAERDWKRAQTLIAKKAIADNEYDLAQADYESAKANVAAGKAAIRQDTASVKTARINLEYCTIRSPVCGTIIDRRVNIGQTVVASLSAPSLFLIAKDLTRMQVWASVNEADIGRIRLHMPVRFSVDAYPGETFEGEVTQIRMNAQMTSNVVTYTVIVATDNSSGKLLTYLTANVHFEVDKTENVLLVPNAALRWVPEVEQVDPALNAASLLAEKSPAEGRGRVWVVGKSGLVQPLEVAVGKTDGTMTVVSGDRLKESLPVVVGEETETGANGQEVADASDTEETRNPFLPKLPKGARPPRPPM